MAEAKAKSVSRENGFRALLADGNTHFCVAQLATCERRKAFSVSLVLLFCFEGIFGVGATM